MKYEKYQTTTSILDSFVERMMCTLVLRWLQDAWWCLF